MLNKQHLWRVIKHWWWLVLVITGFCGVISWLATTYLIDPKFQSVSELVVQPTTDASQDMNSDQINTVIAGYQDLVQSHFVLDQSSTKLQQTAQLAVTTTQLAKQVRLQHQENSNMFELIVTADSAKSAQSINQVLSQSLVNKASRLAVTLRPITITKANYNEAPVAPSTAFMVMIGTLVGFVSSCLILLVITQRQVSYALQTTGDQRKLAKRRR